MKITKKIRSDLLKIRCELEKIQQEYCDEIDDNLCGACAISAVLTYRYFKKIGCKPVFLYGEHHCLITVGGYLVDLTATQFDELNPKVLIDYYDNLGVYYDLEYNQFREWSKPNGAIFYRGWEEQNPYRILKRFKKLNSVV